MQALLNFYYMGMAVYGFLLWQKQSDTEETLLITSWSLNKQLIFIVAGTLLSVITAYYLEATDTSKHPYLDAGVTIFSVMNTWLMAKKIIQNWLYWIVIDAAAVVLYVETAYYATAALFVLNTILAVAGYISWVKLYKQQSPVVATS